MPSKLEVALETGRKVEPTAAELGHHGDARTYAAPPPEDDDDPTLLGIRVISSQFRQIDALVKAGKATSKEMVLAGNLGRSLTLLRGEQRKQEKAKADAQKKLSLDERVEGVVAFVEELPAERRKALLERLAKLR